MNSLKCQTQILLIAMTFFSVLVLFSIVIVSDSVEKIETKVDALNQKCDSLIITIEERRNYDSKRTY